MTTKHISGWQWILAISLSMVVAAWIFWPSPTYSRHAANALEALQNGDADTLWDMSLESRRDDTGFTRETWRTLFEEVVRPVTREFKAWGPTELVEPANAFSGAARVEGIDSDDVRHPFGILAVADSDGSPMVSLETIIRVTWIAQYRMSGGDMSDPLFREKAFLAGYLRHSPTFDRLGIHAFAPLRDPTLPPAEISDRVATVQGRIAEQRRR